MKNRTDPGGTYQGTANEDFYMGIYNLSIAYGFRGKLQRKSVACPIGQRSHEANAELGQGCRPEKKFRSTSRLTSLKQLRVRNEQQKNAKYMTSHARNGWNSRNLNILAGFSQKEIKLVEWGKEVAAKDNEKKRSTGLSRNRQLTHARIVRNREIGSDPGQSKKPAGELRRNPQRGRRKIQQPGVVSPISSNLALP